MNFHMPMIGHRFEQPQNMLAALRVEAINQHSVRCAVVGSKLKLRIIDHDVAIVLDSKLGSHLQRNLGFVGIRSHPAVSWPKSLAYEAFDVKAARKVTKIIFAVFCSMRVRRARRSMPADHSQGMPPEKLRPLPRRGS